MDFLTRWFWLYIHVYVDKSSPELESHLSGLNFFKYSSIFAEHLTYFMVTENTGWLNNVSDLFV